MRPKLRRLGDLFSRSPLVSDESGIALVMALGITLVLTIVLTSVIIMTASGARDAQGTNARQRAAALAEAGLNDAMSVLNANYPATFPGDGCLLRPPASAALPTGLPGQLLPYTCSAFATPPATGFGSGATAYGFLVTPDSTKPKETVQFWGVLRKTIPGIGVAWIVKSTGTVPNPTGPSASPVTRTVSAKVPVVVAPSSPGGTGVLDWVYSGTDTTFSQSVVVSSPLYVKGSITFNNSATVHARLFATGNVTFGGTGSIDGTLCSAGSTPSCLNIGGNLDMQNTNNTVGTSSSPLPAVHIVGTCTLKNVSPVANPCGSATPAPPWTATNVFATATASTRNNTLDAVPFLPMTTSPPYGSAAFCADTVNYSCLDFQTWYGKASPGPAAPCNNGPNRLPDSTFDGNTSFDNSVTPAFNLTPTTPYSCTTLGGSISWDPAGGANGQGLLTINGTVYIDGSAYVTQPSNQVYSYTGIGGIMLSGTLLMPPGSALCASLTSNGKACDITGVSTTATGVNAQNSTTVNVASTTGFPSSGWFALEGTNVTYTGKTATSLTGCSAHPATVGGETVTGNAWDPKKSALAIIANGNGYSGLPVAAQVASGIGIDAKGAQFQGILAATNSVNLSTTSQIQGPIMSVFGQVSPSQSLNLTFPPLPFAPSSAPGQPPTPAILLSPREYGG
jgi:hypothetical protein